MDKILNLDNVDQYNQLYGIETLHPLVSVVNLNEATCGVDFIRLNYGLYPLFLKLEKSCDIRYGRQKYDYEEPFVLFAPGQTAETTSTVTNIRTKCLRNPVPPDLLRGTSLSKTIKSYTFFSYEVNEALHRIRRGADNHIGLPEHHPERAGAWHRQTQQKTDCHLYRIAARLLHAFLRTPSLSRAAKATGMY